MPYLIYGKRTKTIKGHGPDSKFAPLDVAGCRVTKLADAMAYATKEDAQEMIDKNQHPDIIFEIRKAK